MLDNFIPVSEWEVKQGDNPTFSDTLTHDGVAVPLAGATVKFLMRSESGVEVEGVASIINAAAGEVEYEATPDDLAVAEVYKQEWEITSASGKVYTHPSNGWNKVTVLNDLN